MSVKCAHDDATVFRGSIDCARTLVDEKTNGSFLTTTVDDDDDDEDDDDEDDEDVSMGSDLTTTAPEAVAVAVAVTVLVAPEVCAETARKRATDDRAANSAARRTDVVSGTRG